MDDDTVLTAQQVKALQRSIAELEEENLILKKPLQSLRHTQAATERRSGAFRTALALHSVPGAPGQPQHLLQISPPSALGQTAGKPGAETSDIGDLCPYGQASGTS